MAFNPGTSTFRLRLSIKNNGGAAASGTLTLRMSKNAGAYNDVTTSSTNGVKAADAGSSATGDPINVIRLTLP